MQQLKVPFVSDDEKMEEESLRFKSGRSVTIGNTASRQSRTVHGACGYTRREIPF